MIKLLDILREIKINNPNYKFPYLIKTKEDWYKIYPILKEKGYTWMHRELQQDEEAVLEDLPIYITGYETDNKELGLFKSKEQADEEDIRPI